jgi:hypothetical protein
MDAAHAEEDFLASEGLREHGRSHTLLTRAKTACVLAALEGRDGLEIEDWHLAGHLIDHSNAMDESIQRTIHAAARSEAGKSGNLLGVKMDAVEDSKERSAVARVANNLLRLAPRVGYDPSKMPSDPENLRLKGKLMSHLTSRDRNYVDAALELIFNELNQTKEKNHDQIQNVI